MTPDTLRERKHKLEEDILKLVGDFEDETGFYVNQIDYEVKTITNCLGDRTRFSKSIRITLDI